MNNKCSISRLIVFKIDLSLATLFINFFLKNYDNSLKFVKFTSLNSDTVTYLDRIIRPRPVHSKN